VSDHLDQDLSLRVLSEVACFSPFYFQRIFSSFQGESPAEFVNRLRLEKAAGLLLTEPDMKISEIADLTGFSSVSVFSRNFKKRFGATANDFRKNRQLDSKNGQQFSGSTDYVCLVNQLKQGGFMDNIQVKHMPALNLIYCRHNGPFNQIDQAYEKLFRWAGPRGLLNRPDWKTVTVYHDDPNITDIEKVRQDACITIQDEVKTEGEIGKESVAEGRYAVGRFEIDATGFDKAWDAVCLWMSENGYQPAEGTPYELYHNDHTKHPEKKFVLDICVPVKAI
jgi:AraC family transcriptional regulator